MISFITIKIKYDCVDLWPFPFLVLSIHASWRCDGIKVQVDWWSRSPSIHPSIIHLPFLIKPPPSLLLPSSRDRVGSWLDPVSRSLPYSSWTSLGAVSVVVIGESWNLSFLTSRLGLSKQASKQREIERDGWSLEMKCSSPMFVFARQAR